MPMVLFGSSYWSEIVNFEALADHGMIDRADLDLLFRTDSVDEAYDYITEELETHSLGTPGPTL